jgi:hypothetical protein
MPLSVIGHSILNLKGVRSVETSVNPHLLTQSRIPKDLEHQHHRCDNFKSRTIRLVNQVIFRVLIYDLPYASNLRGISLSKTDFQEKNFASNCISLSVKCTTILAGPLVLRGKLCCRDFGRAKNSNGKGKDHPRTGH